MCAFVFSSLLTLFPPDVFPSCRYRRVETADPVSLLPPALPPFHSVPRSVWQYRRELVCCIRLIWGAAGSAYSFTKIKLQHYHEASLKQGRHKRRGVLGYHIPAVAQSILLLVFSDNSLGRDTKCGQTGPRGWNLIHLLWVFFFPLQTNSRCLKRKEFSWNVLSPELYTTHRFHAHMSQARSLIVMWNVLCLMGRG